MAACCMSMLPTLILTKRKSVMELAGKPTAGMYVMILNLFHCIQQVKNGRRAVMTEYSVGRMSRRFIYVSCIIINLSYTHYLGKAGHWHLSHVLL